MPYDETELAVYFDELGDCIMEAAQVHPDWSQYTYAEMANLCMEELGEIARALNDNADTSEILTEVSHLAVTAARMYIEIARRQE